MIVKIDETESFVKILWEAGQTVADRVAGYLEHAMQVCQEGPWQVGSHVLQRVFADLTVDDGHHEKGAPKPQPHIMHRETWEGA